MDASSLIERIALDAPTQIGNGQGGTIMGWEERLRCWAGFKYLRAGEAVLQGRLEGRATVVVTVRANSQSRLIKTDWRMRDVRTGQIYNIRSIIPSTDRAWLELTVESGVAV